MECISHAVGFFMTSNLRLFYKIANRVFKINGITSFTIITYAINFEHPLICFICPNTCVQVKMTAACR